MWKRDCPEFGVVTTQAIGNKLVVTCTYDSVGRVVDGLLALYTFSETEGDIAHDSMGTCHLIIDQPGNARWLDPGLAIDAPVALTGDSESLVTAWQATNEITIEARIEPAGPSNGRLLTLAETWDKPVIRLAQDGDDYWYIKMRTSTEPNAPKFQTIPGTVQLAPTHLTYTRDVEGVENFYLDGELVETSIRPGDFSNWAAEPLAVFNNAWLSKPWLGEVALLAFYNRALTGDEVYQNYNPDRVELPSATGIEDAAWQALGIALNTNAAFYKMAQSMGLGHPISPEFDFEMYDSIYRVQAYNKAVLYCRTGDWGNIKWYEW